MESEKKDLLKYTVFISDTILLGIAFFAAFFTRYMTIGALTHSSSYMGMCLIFLCTYMVAGFLCLSNEEFMERSVPREIWYVTKRMGITAAALFALLFLAKLSQYYSRVVICFALVYTYILITLFRVILKICMKKKYKFSSSAISSLMITTADCVYDTISRIKKTQNWYFRINYLAIIDKDMQGEMVEDIPVVACEENLIDIISNLSLDSVIVHTPAEYTKDMSDIYQSIRSMGIRLVLTINQFDYDNLGFKQIGNLGSFGTVTYSDREYMIRHTVIKRTMDIFGSLIGLVITGIVGIFVVPAIKLESKGPVFFKQQRMGKNGRIFYIYKFRSMYMDAEERKAALMGLNEVDGPMFKMKDDPRITRVGKFIRKTSIDELPQFWNVFKGDMSLVGTRPPTVDEFEQYTPEQRRRISIKPGITGMWQVSGRSSITDFDEVVRLDCKYIDEWSPMLDIKILLKTVLVIFTGRGAS